MARAHQKMARYFVACATLIRATHGYLTKKMEKIFFKLSVIDDYPPVSSESVWAEKISPTEMCIKNIPFYENEANLDDLVQVVPGQDGENIFQQIITPSGNSTIRIVFLEPVHTEINRVLETIVAIGCSWEGGSESFYSINVPEQTSLDDLVEFLVPESESGLLECEYGLVRQ